MYIYLRDKKHVHVHVFTRLLLTCTCTLMWQQEFTSLHSNNHSYEEHYTIRYMFTSTCTCNQQIHVHENLYIIIDYRITDTKIYPSLKWNQPQYLYIIAGNVWNKHVHVIMYKYSVYTCICNTILVHVFGNETEHNALCTIVHTCT